MRPQRPASGAASKRPAPPTTDRTDPKSSNPEHVEGTKAASTRPAQPPPSSAPPTVKPVMDLKATSIGSTANGCASGMRQQASSKSSRGIDERATVSGLSTDNLYGVRRADVVRYDVHDHVPTEFQVITRPASARQPHRPTSSTVTRPAPAHTTMSRPHPNGGGASAASASLAFTLDSSEYTFGTASAQLRMQKHVMSSSSELPQAADIATPGPAPAASEDNRDPHQPPCDGDPSSSSGAPTSSVNHHRSPLPTTDRPQSAKAAIVMEQAFTHLQRVFHDATSTHLAHDGSGNTTGVQAAAPNDTIDIGKMHNFEDVVSYFANHVGVFTPVKFVHMKRASHAVGQTYRPYDLLVVPADQCRDDEDHYIVSATSVVHTLPHGQPAHVQTVSEFALEASTFSVVSKIKFFRTYLKYKWFMRWHQCIRCRHFAQTRAKVAGSLFLAKKTFVGPLRRLYMEIATLHHLPMVKLPAVREGVSLERFQQVMITQKLTVLERYRTTLETVEAKLGQLVQQLRVAADVPDFASMEAIQQYVLFLEDQAAKRKGSMYNPNAVPIAQRKEHMKQRLSELRAALEEYRELTSFVRLVDYLAAEALFLKALSSIQELTHEVVRRDEEKSLYFLISVNFGDAGVVFVPGEDEVLRVTNDVSEEIIASAVYLPRLIASKTLKSVLESGAAPPKTLSLSALLREDLRVIEARRICTQRMLKDFEEGYEATRHFGKNRTWLEFVNKTWPGLLTNWSERFTTETLAKEYVLMPSTSASAAGGADGAAPSANQTASVITTEEFADVFKKVDEAFLCLKEMHAVRRGSLVITSTVVLDFLAAKLKDITVECREKLLSIAKSRLDRMATTLNGRIKALQERPSQLNKFAAFTQFAHKQVAELPLFSEACEQIEQLYTIAEQNGCEPGQDAGRREMVLGRVQDHHGGGGGSSSSIRGRFEEAAFTAKEFLQSHLKDMSKRLATELEAEHDSISTYATLAESQILLVFNSDVNECLSFLTQLEENISASEEKLRVLAGWSRLFENANQSQASAVVGPNGGSNASAASPPAAYLANQSVSEEAAASIAEVKGHVKAKRELWTTIGRFHECRQRCFAAPIGDTDVPQYAKDIDELYTKTYNRLHPRHQSEASERLLEVLREEKQLMPTLLHLGNRHLKREHWAKILANQSRTFDATMTLETLRLMKLFDAFYRDVITEQSAVATGEATLLSNLEEIRTKWSTMQFQTKPFKDLKDSYILDDVTEIVQVLEEHQLLIQSCLASRFVSGVRSQVDDWERRLHLLGLVIEEWVAVQRSWMYLAFIFASDDMKRQLPSETAMFRHVDSVTKELIHRANTFKNCVVVATDAPVLETLRDARAALDTIQKRLEEYLETKRAAFPRFYFLSNDELLSILADARNPRSVRPHLTKCFDCVQDFIFHGDNAFEIQGVVSPEGERLIFVPSPVLARGGVEYWLKNVEASIRSTLKHHMISTMQARAAAVGHAQRIQWMLKVQQGGGESSSSNRFQSAAANQGFPAQCIHAVDTIDWVMSTEAAIRELDGSDRDRDGMGSNHALTHQLAQYVAYLSETVKTIRQPALNALQRALIQTMLVLNVHNRDVLRHLVDCAVTSVESFEWRRQLRLYLSQERQVVYIEQVRAILDYGYEYLGNTRRLVITPLTDRAFLTCTQALHLNLGAAPQGPAGTGKTESIKDLGKVLARHVVVFNCSDGINAQIMGQMFAGLAQAGSWACFDEFNRIELEVLSVVAQQMLEITSALSSRLSRISFEGHELELHPNFGVFVTMNPGYAGRTELPDNLQALFRPVCMMLPDYRLVAEIMFFSEGFLDAGVLATKMVHLYQLASQQLSKQDHYDFGMRAVKSILVVAGALKRAEPDTAEDVLLVRAMRDANLPKFLKDDALLFAAILRDLFPGLEVGVSVDELLRRSVEGIMASDRVAEELSATDRFVEKALQVHATMSSRTGVMLVGPTLTGKSCCSHVLAAALGDLFSSGSAATTPFALPVTRFSMNPKSVSGDELYGAVNGTTGEWMDGILSHTVRRVCRAVAGGTDEDDAGPCRYWIHLDGPVDAMWIENLNTVLDDSRMLCLVNGERMRLPKEITFLFEVQDLCAASPATVSRCGMVYFDTDVVTWRERLACGLRCLAKKYPNDVWFPAVMDRLVKSLIHPTMEHLEERSFQGVASNAAHRIMMFLDLLEVMLASRDASDDDPQPVAMPPIEIDEDGQELPIDATLIKFENGEINVSNLTQGGTQTSTSGSATSGLDRNLSPSVNADAAQERLFEMVVIFSAIWGLGGNEAETAIHSSSTGRSGFSRFIQERIEELDPLFGAPHDTTSSSLKRLAKKQQQQRIYSSMDADSEPQKPVSWVTSVFDATIHKGSLRWVDWSYKVPPFLYRRRSPFGDLLVSTPQSTATSYIASLLLSGGGGGAGSSSGDTLFAASTKKCHVLINGPSGGGKSVNALNSIIGDLLNTGDAGALTSRFSTFCLVMSAQTTAQQLNETLESKLRKHPSKRKDQLRMGPPSGQSLIMFVDDVNMPQCDVYGTSPTLECLRQLLVHRGTYDTRKCVFRAVQDVTTLACCGPTGGNRATLSPRLTSAFFMLYQGALNDASLNRIFGSILHGFLSRFTADVRGLATALTRSSIDVYTRVCAELLPTPERAHYIFNTRDLGRVVQGLTQATPKECLTRTDALQLWVHECLRVFSDRLISTTDRDRFSMILNEVAVNRFSQPIASTWGRRMYADFTSLAEVPVYRPVELGGKPMQDVLTQKMREYAIQNNRDLDLVMFDDAVVHLTRLCRILRQARGHAMLIGINGTGRQSLASLAAFLCRCQKHTIQQTSYYDHQDFRKDIRNALKAAGCDSVPVVFLLSDHQIVKEVFLEDISCLLNTGEIANLWDADDMEIIVSSARDRVRRLKRPETIPSMMQTFVSACRDNLHIVLAMTPMGPALFRRIRNFPSLINCMTIDWYDSWPAAALKCVAVKTLTEGLTAAVTAVASKRIISDGEHPDDIFGEATDDDGLPKSAMEDLARVEDLAELFVYVHTTVEQACVRFAAETGKQAYCTPTSFIGLLQSFAAMLKDQRETSDDAIQRFQLGLERLKDANRRVDDMRAVLTKLQPELVKSTEETERFAAEVDKEQRVAREVAQVVANEEAICSRMMREAQMIKDECQAELDKAMPAYNEALDALNALNPKDIQEAKAYITPPKKVEMVMDAVLTILDESLGWDNAKKVLGRPDLVNVLRTYDVNSVSEKSLRKLKKFTENDDFRPEAIKSVSKACVSFCQWCLAVENYCEVLKLLEPKRQRLAAAEAALEKAKADLAKKQAELAAIEAKLEKLRQQHEDSMAHLRHLEAEKTKTELHLSRAEKLITGLAAEHERWSSSVTELQSKTQYTLSSSALASAFVAYGGVFDPKFRDELLRLWMARCDTLNFVIDPSKVAMINGSKASETGGGGVVDGIVDPVMVRHWHLQGLPVSPFSVQNAVIVSKSTRWCLCIDPHSQANVWIKNTYKHQGLVVLRMSDPNLTRHMEVAVRGGLAVLIEDVGTTLDASLDPVLRRETFRSGGRLMLTVRDQPVEYNPSFFLILTCREAHPHFLPDVHVKTTVLNFDVTSQGLEDQMLSEVVRCEERSLEEKADAILVQVTETRAQLKAIEDQILALLSNSSGNMLDNDMLITTLQQSKKAGVDLTQGLETIQQTAAQIQTAREVYRPVAACGSMLFQVTQDVGRIAHMYQTSLNGFLTLFRRSLISVSVGATDVNAKVAENASKSAVVADRDRLKELIDVITRDTYVAVCMSIFEKDRMVFRFLLAVRMIRSNPNKVAEESWSPESWNYFLRESGGVLVEDPLSLPGEWLPESVWDNIQFLSTLEGFDGLAGAIADDDSDGEWHRFREDPFMDAASRPAPFRSLSLWRSLVFARTFVPSLVSSLAEAFIQKHLGPQFNETPAFDLSLAFTQSAVHQPLMFLLCVGTDPNITYQQFAEKQGMSSQSITLSLGQGQGARAEAALQRAMSEGQWVFLQNCHVFTSWLPSLARIVEQLVSSTISAGAAATGASSGATGGRRSTVSGGNVASSAFTTEVHPNFRLWLSTLPCETFPVSLLQACVKISREPPRGVKANLKETISLAAEHDAWRTLPMHVSGGNQLIAWRRLLYSVALFHAVVQERRKYGPLGWNVPYGWNLVDFENSMRILQSVCEGECLGVNPLTGYSAFSSWEAVYDLVGTVHYGGRVTDSWDNRTLHCLLRRLVNNEVFTGAEKESPDAFAKQNDTDSAPHAATLPPSVAEATSPQTRFQFRIPTYFDPTVLAKSIEAIPSNDPAELFGLHHNAERLVFERESSHLITTVIGVQASVISTDGGSSIMSAADAKEALQLVAELSARVPVPIDLGSENDSHERNIDPRRASVVPVGDGESHSSENHDSVFVRDAAGTLTPLANVALQECRSYNHLVTHMAKQLRSLQLALKGATAMNSDMEVLLRSLRMGQVPVSWEAVAYPSLKPLFSWISDLSQRLDFFRDWVEGALTPNSFWIGAFTFPQGFLTALLQAHSRQSTIAVDQLVVATHITQETDPIMALLPTLSAGAYIHGLTLEGARWNLERQCLEDFRGKELSSSMPIVALVPQSGSAPDGEDRYDCPLYRIATRAGSLSTTGVSTNFVLSVALHPGESSVDHWVERGCALIASTSE